MIWKKTIYDTLTSCATLCDEFATECSRSAEIDRWYRSIFLNLDCADLCRQLAILYVRGPENTRLLAKTCLEVCEKCAQEVQPLTTRRAQRVYRVCQQAMQSCTSILAMGNPPDAVSNPPASRCSGIDLGEMLLN